jgi:hypothetical protein
MSDEFIGKWVEYKVNIDGVQGVEYGKVLRKWDIGLSEKFYVLSNGELVNILSTGWRFLTNLELIKRELKK